VIIAVFGMTQATKNNDIIVSKNAAAAEGATSAAS